jgi:hypothetical protein
LNIIGFSAGKRATELYRETLVEAIVHPIPISVPVFCRKTLKKTPIFSLLDAVEHWIFLTLRRDDGIKLNGIS